MYQLRFEGNRLFHPIIALGVARFISLWLVVKNGGWQKFWKGNEKYGATYSVEVGKALDLGNCFLRIGLRASVLVETIIRGTRRHVSDSFRSLRYGNTR
jgi:hypothetical protein